MQNKFLQNKEFCTLWRRENCLKTSSMLKPKNISELLAGHGKRLKDLQSRSLQRRDTLAHVRSQAPLDIAKFIVSAGVQDGCLTIGVTAGSWAARLRYVSDALRADVAAAMNSDIERVRIKVVPSSAPGAPART